MDYFKLTRHYLLEGCSMIEQQLNAMRKHYLLYHCQFTQQELLCLWVKIPDPPLSLPLGFAVV